MQEIHKLLLSEQSKLLMLYYKELQKNLKKYYSFSQNNNLKSEKNSKNYINFQKYIFNKLDSLYKSSLKDLCLDSNNDLSKFRKFYYSQSSEYKSYVRKIYNSHFNNNKYITQETKKYIKDGENFRENSLLIYNIPYKKSTINFHFFIYNNVGISQKNMEYYDSKVLHMSVLINLITLLTENNNIYESTTNKICSKDGLNVYLLLTPFTRKLENIDKNKNQNQNQNQNKQIILGAKHCNGGFCYGCVNAGEIIIYRFEEWFKVFCHECAHNFGVDNYIWKFIDEVKSGNNTNNTNTNNSNNSNKLYHDFLNNFNLSANINNTNFDIGLQECIVEFWGEFLNNAIFSYNYSKSCNLSKSSKLSNSSKLFKIYLSTFEKIANYELFHGLLQTTKILEANSLTFELLMKNNEINNENNKINNYRENSHLFSYYILKTLIIYDYKNFVISNNQNNKIIFNYANKLENMKLFFDNIINNANNKEFIKIIKLVEDLYEFLREYKNCKKLNFIISNLRMSILEF